MFDFILFFHYVIQERERDWGWGLAGDRGVAGGWVAEGSICKRSLAQHLFYDKLVPGFYLPVNRPGQDEKHSKFFCTNSKYKSLNHK